MRTFLFLAVLLCATTVDAWEYKYNWKDDDKDVSKRWTMTSKDTELTYDWKSTDPDLGKRWKYVRPDESQQYDWRSEESDISKRWEYAPERRGK